LVLLSTSSYTSDTHSGDASIRRSNSILCRCWKWTLKLMRCGSLARALRRSTGEQGTQLGGPEDLGSYQDHLVEDKGAYILNKLVVCTEAAFGWCTLSDRWSLLWILVIGQKSKFHEASSPPILTKVPIIFRYLAGEAETPFPADPMKDCSVPCWRPVL